MKSVSKEIDEVFVVRFEALLISETDQQGWCYCEIEYPENNQTMQDTLRMLDHMEFSGVARLIRLAKRSVHDWIL